MGAAGRGGAGVASGFVAGLLIGIAAVVIVAPPPSTVVLTQTSRDSQNVSTGNSPVTTNTALNSLEGHQESLANTGMCASALALEQRQRSILEANIAVVENDLRTLRENRGCDAECKHVVSTAERDSPKLTISHASPSHTRPVRAPPNRTKNQSFFDCKAM